MCDAIMRLFKSLDDGMYQPGFNRWRHFMPATFAELALNGDNYLGDNRIRSSFVGNHITYNIEDCSMLVVPVVRDGRCSCYFWNFEQQRIHVLDPLMMRCCTSSVHRRHGQNVTIINEAISRCEDTYFQGWNVNMIGWDRCYTVGLGQSCHRCASC
ncbi:hypothetical protein PVAP13_1NG276200 [Panicum virgatum]|uniref:Uncharacterized protein n=1 Tax=Panicum virgatum TaxID=38727 RepID=A0A8T0X1S4_PANVG|nr:hypothetical protein PVAP13_1NG276200 [Panicum virgatum]